MKVVQLDLPRAITRGALELRENLTHGQAISNYTVATRHNTWRHICTSCIHIILHANFYRFLQYDMMVYGAGRTL